MPVEALLLPLRMPLFCSFEIIALVGCGIIGCAFAKLGFYFIFTPYIFWPRVPTTTVFSNTAGEASMLEPSGNS